ncbi:MAG: DNA alkylation repair protein [Planctomycetota bacterium]
MSAATSREIERRIRALPGLATARVRAVRREFSRKLRAAPPREVVALADRLLSRKAPGLRFLAFEVVAHHRGALASLRPRDLERLGRSLDGWGSVDTFSVHLMGPAWREGQVPDGFVRKWARSKDRWRRRAALVATVPLNLKSRGGRGDRRRTLELCRLLARDRDDMVVKAVSWALRELAKRDPGAVRAFLRQQGDALARRVRREVRNKLETGLKNP